MIYFKIIKHTAVISYTNNTAKKYLYYIIYFKIIEH